MKISKYLLIAGALLCVNGMSDAVTYDGVDNTKSRNISLGEERNRNADHHAHRMSDGNIQNRNADGNFVDNAYNRNDNTKLI